MSEDSAEIRRRHRRYHITPFYQTLALMMFSQTSESGIDHYQRSMADRGENSGTESGLSSEVRFIEAVIIHHCARNDALSVKKFKELPKLTKKEVTDDQCGICYDQFVFEQVKKRQREDDGPQRKRRRLDSGEVVRSRDRNTDNDEPEEEEEEEERDRRNNNNVDPRVIFPDIDDRDLSTPSAKEEFKNCLHHATKLPCGHVFGTNCLAEWLQNSDSCPYCRAKIDDPYKKSDDNVVIQRYRDWRGEEGSSVMTGVFREEREESERREGREGRRNVADVTRSVEANEEESETAAEETDRSTDSDSAESLSSSSSTESPSSSSSSSSSETELSPSSPRDASSET